MYINQNLENKILKINKFLIYCIPFLSLLVFKSNFFVFIVPKVIIFRILVEVLLFFYLFLILINKQYLPRKNVIFIITSIFLLYILIRSFFAPNFNLAFWGNFERMDGIFSLIHYYLLFVITFSIIRKQDDWVQFFKFSTWSSILVCLYGVMQYFNISMNGFVENAGIDRIGSTLGNAGFFSGYLIFQIFISFFLFKVSIIKNWKIFYFSIFIFQIITLFLTKTRGAFIGFVVGIIIYFILSLFDKKNKKKHKIVIFIILVVLILSYLGLWLNRDSIFVQQTNILKRYVDINLSTITAQTRFWTWGSAWNAWQENLLFGWGHNNFEIAFNKYFNAQHFTGFGSEAWFDKAHNIIFDLGVNLGFIGIFIYISIFLYILWKLFANFIKDLENKWLWAGLISLFIAYFIQNLFVFDTVVVYIYYFVFLGFTIYLFENYKDDFKSKTKINSFIIYILGIVIILSIYYFNIIPFNTNKNLVYAIRLTQDINKLDVSHKNLPFDYYKKINNLVDKNSLGEEEYLLRIAGALIDDVTNNQISISDFKKGFDLIEPRYKEVESKKVGDTQFSWILGRLYNAAFKIFQDQDMLNKAEEILNKAYLYAPDRFEIVYELSQTYVYAENYEKAEDLFLSAKEEYSNLSSFHWYLGFIYAIDDKLDLADQSFKIAIDLGYPYGKSYSDLMQYVNLYIELNNIERVIEAYELALKLEPDNYLVMGSLAAAYYEINDLDKARDYALKSLEYNTEDEQFKVDIQNFLNNLNN